MRAPLLTTLAFIFLCLGLSGTMNGDESGAPPGPLSERPTVEEISEALQDRSLSAFATITPKNRSAVVSILRRIAAREDREIAQNIDPWTQAGRTNRALSVLASILDKSTNLAYFQRFFESYNGTPESVAHEPYAKAIIEIGEEVEPYFKEKMLKNIAGTAMHNYAFFAHRMGKDDEAVPALLRKLDHPNDDIAINAARALEELQSSAAVEAIVARLRSDEARFPLGPWDPTIQKQLDEIAAPDTRFGKARILVDVLGTMKTTEARAAASATLDRWKAIYRKHPQRDAILFALSVPKQREELTRKAGEVAAADPPSSETVRDRARTTAPTAPVALKQTPSPAASTAVDSSSPSLGTLWACAAAAVALLVGLLVFWKRHSS